MTPSGRETVGCVVDHEIERDAAELLGDQPAQPRIVGLVELVIGVQPVTQIVLVDELLERGRRVALEVEGNEPFEVGEHGDEGGAAALADAELDDVPRPQSARSCAYRSTMSRCFTRRKCSLDDRKRSATPRPNEMGPMRRFRSSSHSRVLTSQTLQAATRAHR